MRKTLLAAAAAALLVSGAAVAADTTRTTTTTWTNEYGDVIRQDSTTKQYKSDDVTFETREGVEVPATVELHPLPSTIHVDNPDRYSYVIINHRPVVVDRSDRRIVHVW